jgi:hypothetical protein
MEMLESIAPMGAIAMSWFALSPARQANMNGNQQ